MIRAAAILAALVAAGLLVAVAIDARRWEHARSRPPTLVGHLAERVLGTTDDVALRRAIAAFVTAEHTPFGFDNGANQARTRALAQGQLADVAWFAAGCQRLTRPVPRNRRRKESVQQSGAGLGPVVQLLQYRGLHVRGSVRPAAIRGGQPSPGVSVDPLLYPSTNSISRNCTD